MSWNELQRSPQSLDCRGVARWWYILNTKNPNFESLEGLGVENVGIFLGHLVYFRDNRYFSWSFGTCFHVVVICTYQDKSGNPGQSAVIQLPLHNYRTACQTDRFYQFFPRRPSRESNIEEWKKNWFDDWLTRPWADVIVSFWAPARRRGLVESSTPAAEETESMGREIESRQGVCT
jgi:hypothetical protein